MSIKQQAVRKVVLHKMSPKQKKHSHLRACFWQLLVFGSLFKNQGRISVFQNTTGVIQEDFLTNPCLLAAAFHAHYLFA